MEKTNVNFNEIKYDNEQSVRDKIKIVREGHKSKKLLDINYRMNQIKKLRASLLKYEKEIHLSHKLDLGQSEFSSYFAFSIIKNDLDDIIHNLNNWVAPRYVDTPVLLAPAKSYIIPEPYGVCLVMSSWNFQLQTLIMPIAQALAAGNTIIAKPSEMAVAGAVISQIICEELDPDIIQFVQGGAEVCIELLKNKLDVIVFTGSPQKGVLVAKAAAEFLTPCILELGGQNPAIVDHTANLDNAVYNLVNGRFMNAGQVCLSPEYVLVDKRIYSKIQEVFKTTVDSFFGENPKHSQDYSRIINNFHCKRLSGLLNSLKKSNTKLICGGDFDIDNKYISPTVCAFDSFDQMKKSELTEGEIFGPIIYLCPYDNIDECINYINDKDKPLALYYFGKDNISKEKVKRYTSSGAFVTNDTVVHFTNSDLPFGGVGNSGYSAYHGITGFNNLSHLKPVLERKENLLKMRYPPYTDGKQKVMKFLLGNVNFSQAKFIRMIIGGLILLGLVIYHKKIINYASRYY